LWSNNGRRGVGHFLLMFVIALERRTGEMVAAGYDRLEELKKGLSAHSSIEGTAWFGIASILGTALRISRGEAQLEPSGSS
jgi:hypothetical protein